MEIKIMSITSRANVHSTIAMLKRRLRELFFWSVSLAAGSRYFCVMYSRPPHNWNMFAIYSWKNHFLLFQPCCFSPKNIKIVKIVKIVTNIFKIFDFLPFYLVSMHCIEYKIYYLQPQNIDSLLPGGI